MNEPIPTYYDLTIVCLKDFYRFFNWKWEEVTKAYHIPYDCKEDVYSSVVQTSLVKALQYKDYRLQLHGYRSHDVYECIEEDFFLYLRTELYHTARLERLITQPLLPRIKLMVLDQSAILAIGNYHGTRV